MISLNFKTSQKINRHQKFSPVLSVPLPNGTFSVSPLIIFPIKEAAKLSKTIGEIHLFILLLCF